MANVLSYNTLPDDVLLIEKIVVQLNKKGAEHEEYVCNNMFGITYTSDSSLRCITIYRRYKNGKDVVNSILYNYSIKEISYATVGQLREKYDDSK